MFAPFTKTAQTRQEGLGVRLRWELFTEQRNPIALVRIKGGSKRRQRPIIPDTDPLLISTLLSIHLPLFPLLKVELSCQFSCDLVHDVLAGSMNLAIAAEPPISPMLSATKIAQTQFYITMCKDDETAVHQQLSMDRLNGREWVLFERRVHPALYDAIIRVAQERRVTPAQIHHVMTAEEALAERCSRDSTAREIHVRKIYDTIAYFAQSDWIRRIQPQ
jgi:hypothetical protein